MVVDLSADVIMLPRRHAKKFRQRRDRGMVERAKARPALVFLPLLRLHCMRLIA